MRELYATSIFEEPNIAFRVSVGTVTSWTQKRNENCETGTISCHGYRVKATAQQCACHSWPALNLAERTRIAYMDVRGMCGRIHNVVKCQYDLA